jgi:hypothetical protein
MTAARSLLLYLLLIAAVPASAALYGDEGKDVKSGDLNDQDYWWTQYDMTMLDLCLKQHQPEGKIGLELASTTRRIDDLVKKYPQHAGLKQWKQHADEVVAKIDPNASRGESFKPGCPWDQSNFGQAWVNWRHAQMQLAAKDEEHAFGLLQNVKQNFDILLKPGRMDDYPADLRKWVTDTNVELNKIYEPLRQKTHH